MKFWDFILKKLQQKFLFGLSKEELNREGISFRDSLQIPSLIDRISDLVGLKLSDQALHEIHKHPDSFVLVDSDIEEVNTKVKHMNISFFIYINMSVYFAEGMSLYLKSLTLGFWNSKNCNFKGLELR